MNTNLLKAVLWCKNLQYKSFDRKDSTQMQKMEQQQKWWFNHYVDM